MKKDIILADKAIIQPGGWALYTKRDAIEVVKECSKKNMVILGIDGFFLGTDVTHPDLPHLKTNSQSVQPSLVDSVDFSSPEFTNTKNSIYEQSIDFISARADNMFFEIVCAEK